MKLAVLRRRYVAWGGAERFTQQFLGRLAACGHDVHLFCEGWTEAPPGVSVHRVPRVGRGSTLGTLGYALLAPRIAHRLGVDLIQSFDRTVFQHLYRAGEGCHRQWLSLRRRHLDGGSAGLERLRTFHWAVLALERHICRGGGAGVIVVNSRMVEEDLRLHYGPLRAETALIRSGVDVDRFHPERRLAERAAARRTLGLPADRVVLLSLGSGFARKGVPLIIRALGRLGREARLRPVVLVVGKGDPRALARLAAREGVDAQLRVLGVVEDSVPLYAAADLFVLPTVYDPASNATLEALAMGLAVVTSRLNGAAEIIEHERSGWLLDDPSDAGQLARVIEGAAEGGRRETVGAEGRRAVEPWTWERHLEATERLYAHVADGERR